MTYVRFSTGFVAGLFDNLGWIKARNLVLRLVRYDGATMDGFDCAVD